MTLATHLMINSFTCGLTNAGESSYRETLQNLSLQQRFELAIQLTAYD